MASNSGIIAPIKGQHPKSFGSRCIMTANMDDQIRLSRLLRVKNERKLMNSRVFYNEIDPQYCVAGPFIGAPYAVMLLELLVAWGIEEFIFWGWCGSIASHVHISDLVIPDKAFVEEGTSALYAGKNIYSAIPYTSIQNRLIAICKSRNLICHNDSVWSTDAIYRETAEKMEFYRKSGVICVEMEASALFCVADFRQVKIGCILVVSDELATLKWRPGFSEKRFMQARRQIDAVIASYLSETENIQI